MALQPAESTLQKFKLCVSRQVTSASGKHHWKTGPDETIVVDDVPYIKVKANSYVLLQIVWEDNDHAPEWYKGVSLTCCNGYNELIATRNKMQAIYLTPDVVGTGTLFEIEASSKKRAKGSMSERKIKRDRHEVMTMAVSLMDGNKHDISVVRPVHPRETLYVQYDPVMIAVVVQCMRESGFTDMPPANALGPNMTGIRKISESRFLIVYKDKQGTKRYKNTTNIEEAIAFRNESTPAVFDDGEFEEGVEDADAADAEAEAAAQVFVEVAEADASISNETSIDAHVGA